MAFTDDDLKRLQAALLVASEFDDAVLNIKPKIVVALLARLEAAEWVAERFFPLQPDLIAEEKKRIREWRKAAGK